MDFDQNPAQPNLPPKQVPDQPSSMDPSSNMSNMTDRGTDNSQSQVKLNPFATATNDKDSDAPSPDSLGHEANNADSLSYSNQPESTSNTATGNQASATDSQLTAKILLTTGPLFLLICLIISLIMISR